MHDARFQNGNSQDPQSQNTYQTSQPAPTGNAWRGILAGVASLTKPGVALLAIAAGAILIGEATLSADSPFRPANMYAAFVGDSRAGVEDRVRQVATKWALIERDGVERITRETIAFTKEIEVRALDLEKRIEAVNLHQLPSLVTNLAGEIRCASDHVEAGRMAGRCEETEALRRDLMAERNDLIGPVQILQTDEQLLTSMGLSPDFMSKFE